MSYGLKIYNSNNELQIDGNSKNFCLYDSGIWSFSSEGYKLCNFSPTLNVPIVAVRLQAFYSCIIAGLKQNASNEFYQVTMQTDAPMDIHYAVFTQGSQLDIPSGEYGLAVYGDTGEVIFHSFSGWCKMRSFTSFPNPLKTDCSGAVGDYVDISVTDANNNLFTLHPFTDAGAGPMGGRYRKCPLMKVIDDTTIRVHVAQLSTTTGDLYCSTVETLNLIEFSL